MRLLSMAGLLALGAGCELFANPDDDCVETEVEGLDMRVQAWVTVVGFDMQGVPDVPIELTYEVHRCGVDGIGALHGDEGATESDGTFLGDVFEVEIRNWEDRVEVAWSLPAVPLDGRETWYPDEDAPETELVGIQVIPIRVILNDR